jgi:hypothetical protein
MLVADSLPRKPGFDSMVTSDGIRIGQIGTSAAFVHREVPLPNVIPSVFYSHSLPHTVSTGLLGVAETRQRFTPHLQANKKVK